MQVKEELRIVGFDDGPFEPRKRGKALVIGVVTRGGKFLDGVMSTKVSVDGLDATRKIIETINKSKQKPQLRCVMFNGITIAGFNLIDVKKVFEETRLPVIVVNRKKPNLEKMKKALKNLSSFEKRWKIVERAGPIKRVEVKPGKFIYFQNVGVDDETTRKIIKISCTHSLIPEPLRLAHIIASGVVKGDSGGRP